MNLLKLFHHQSIFLVTFYRCCFCQDDDDITAATCELRLPNDSETTVFRGQALVRAAENDDESNKISDKYYFKSDYVQKILGRPFTSHDVEVRYVFGSSLDFSLLIADRHFIVLCNFETIEDLQIFYSQQRKLVTLKGTEGAKILKSFKFESQKYVPTPVADNNVFYQKSIADRREIGATKSFNLVRVYSKRNPITGAVIQTQEADLVFLPRTYNVAGLIDDDKFVLCLRRLPYSIFLLRFTNPAQAMLFYGMVLQDVNAEIPCFTTPTWLTRRKHYYNDPEPFDLPEHPFLDSNRS